MCVGCRTKKNKVIPTSPCKYLYNELVTMDLKTLDLYKTTKESDLLLINGQLRIWIKELNNKCPDEDEINNIRDILNNYEYPIN